MIYEPSLLPTPFFRRRTPKNHWKPFDPQMALLLPHVEVPGDPDALTWDEANAEAVRASWTSVAVLRVDHLYRTIPRVKIGFLNSGTCQILDRPFALSADSKYAMTLGYESVTFFVYPFAGFDDIHLEHFTTTRRDDPVWGDLHYI